MKPMFCNLSVALALLATPVAASAKGITYDCDTAANHFSELVLPVSSVRFTVSGNVKLNAIAASSTYAPLARIQIAASAATGQSPSVYAGFSITALPAKAGNTTSELAAVQMLSWNLSEKQDDIVPLSVLTKPGTVQRFTLSYNGNTVLVSLGNETKHFALQITDPVVRLVCSSENFASPI